MTVSTVADPAAGRRSARFSARQVLWEESRLKRVARCGAHAVGAQVGVRSNGESAGFAGLETCGSVWACPVCSHKIAAARAHEVAAAVRGWQATGGRVAFLTLTMRHSKGQRLASLWDDGVSYAWSKATSGRGWVSDKATHGVAGWVRVIEVTHGANGWHVHVHCLLFLEGLEVEPVEFLGAQMFTRWRDALVRKGFEAPLSSYGGLDIRLVGAGQGDEMGDYFAKQTYAPDLGAGWELAGGSGKRGRGGNRTPFGLLLAVVEEGDAEALDLWHEWEKASKGRRQMTWARGFRASLDLEAERTDQELAEAAELEGEVLVLIPAKEWRRHARWHAASILEHASSAATLRAFLDRAGIAWGVPPGLPPRL